MKHLKVCFIGVGSIAQRHIRNLHEICRDQEIDLHTDVVRSGHGRELSAEMDSLIRNRYTSIGDLPENYDIIFITNPTKKHLETLIACSSKAKNFFVEKPFVDRSQIEDAMRDTPEVEGVLYVACPIRHTKIIRYLKEQVDPKTVHAVRAISSSYLPDWRPGTDYRNTYSAHSDLGGGVSIDLIHEWDYLQYLFGFPEKIQCLICRKSDLELDSDDLAVYIAEYPDKAIELHLDYFGRKTIRELQLFTEADTLTADLVNSRITGKSAESTISFAEDRDDYQKRELLFFLDLIEKKKQQGICLPEYNDSRTAIKTLGLTLGKTEF